MENINKEAVLAAIGKGFMVDGENGKESVALATRANIVFTQDGNDVEAVLTDIATQIAGMDYTNPAAVKALIDARLAPIMDGAVEEMDSFLEVFNRFLEKDNNIVELTKSIANTVQKEEGKGLSSNDFTDALKTGLEDWIAEKAEIMNHIADTDIHVTAEKKQTWDGKSSTYFANSAEEASNIPTQKGDVILFDLG